MNDFSFSPRRQQITPCLPASVVKILAAIIFLLPYFTSCQANPYAEGERLYKTHCANCHMDDGSGLSALIPPLAGADFLKSHRERLPCILKYGLKDTIRVNDVSYAEEMPGVPTLSEVHITNILNYVNHSWGNDQPVYRLDEVQQLLKQCD